MRTDFSAESFAGDDSPAPFGPEILETADGAEPESFPLLRPLGPVNLRFVILLLLAVAGVGAGLKSLHDWQVQRMAGLLLKRSQRAEARGEFGQAAGALEQFLRLMPDDIENRSRLPNLLMKLTASPSGHMHAFLVMEDVLRRDESRHEVRRLLVSLLMELGRYRDAAGHLEYLLASAGQTAEWHAQLGDCHARMGDYRAAADEYRSAIGADPQNLEVCESLADILVDRLDQPEQADQVIDQMVNRNVDSRKALLVRARYRRRHGQLQSAVIDAKRVYLLAPEDPDVLVLVADLIAAQADAAGENNAGVDAAFDPETVQIQLRDAAARQPEDSRLYQSMARLDLLDGGDELAEQRLRNGMRSAPDRLELQLSLTEVLIASGKLNEARMELSRLRKQNVLPVILLYFEAKILMAEDDWLEAIALLQSVRDAKLAPGRMVDQVDLHLALCYHRIGNHEQRLTALRRALQTSPDSSHVRERFAEALAATGRTKEALAQYRQTKQTPEVLLQVARLLLNVNRDAAPDQRDWEAIQRALDEAARFPEILPDVLVLRAAVAVTRQQNDEAVQLLQRACQRMPGEHRLWLAYAALLGQQNKYSEAAKILQDTRDRLGNSVPLVLMQAADVLRTADEPVAALSKFRSESMRSSWTSAEQQRLLEGFAELHWQAGDSGAARDLWIELTRISPDHLPTWMRLLNLGLRGGNSELVEEVLAEVQRIDGQDGPYTRMANAARGIMLGQNGDRSQLVKAAQLLEAAAQQLPSTPYIPLALAQINELQGNEDAAIEHYLQAVARDVRSPDVIRRVVTLLYGQKRYSEAQQIIRNLQDDGFSGLSGDFGRLVTEVSLRNEQFERAVELARKAVGDGNTEPSSRLWLAQVLYSAGRKDEAHAEYLQLIEESPSLPEVWVGFVAFLHECDRSDEGIKLLETAAEHLPESQAALTLAQCWLILDNPDRARQHIAQALLDRPDDVQVLRQAAAFYQRQGETKEAVPLLEQILNAADHVDSADAVLARRSLAAILGERGGWDNFSRATDLIGRNLELQPNSAADQKLRARLLASRADRSLRREAVALLETAHQRDPLKAQDQLLLTRLYIDLGNWVQGRDALLSLVYGHGEAPEHLEFGIRQMLAHGESDGLVEEWVASLKRQQPGHFGTAELEARYMAATGDYAAAVQLLKSRLQNGSSDANGQSQNPQPHEVAEVLAEIAQKLDKIGRTVAAEKIAVEAELLFRQAAANSPERVLELILFLSRNWRAAEAVELCETAWASCPPEKVSSVCVQLLGNRQIPGEASRKLLGRLQIALDQHPDSCPVVANAAHAAHLTGNYSRAIDLYRRALTCSPESALIANELAYLLATSAATGPDGLDEASRHIGQALQQTGPVPDLLDTRGLIHLHQGRNAAAVDDFRRSLKASDSPATSFHLAQAYLALGKTAAAQSALKQAIAGGLHADVVHDLEREQFQELRARLEHLPASAAASETPSAIDRTDPFTEGN